jgi:hypothetical protein
MVEATIGATLTLTVLREDQLLELDVTPTELK